VAPVCVPNYQLGMEWIQLQHHYQFHTTHSAIFARVNSRRQSLALSFRFLSLT